jgi:hypothetical protein
VVILRIANMLRLGMTVPPFFLEWVQRRGGVARSTNSHPGQQ